MSRHRYMLLWDPPSWRLVDASSAGNESVELSVSPDMTPDEIADEVVRAVGAPRSTVMLSGASQLCLSATLSFSSKSGVLDPTSLRFELERVLPLAAEEFSADLVVSGSAQKSRLAVAIENSRLNPVVESLRERGIELEYVTPMSLVALQQIVPQLADSSETLLVWKDENRYECFHLIQGMPVSWSVVPANVSEIRRFTNAFLLARPTATIRCVVVNDEPLLTAILNSNPGVEGTAHDSSPIAVVAATEAASVLGGRNTPWIDLLSGRDPYRAIRPYLNAALGTALILGVVVTTSMLMRAYRYDRVAEQFDRQQRFEYAKAFPDQQVPRAIVTRLSSEVRKMTSTQNASQPLPQVKSALSTLYRVTAALPTTASYRLFEIECLRDGRITLGGDADSYAASVELVTALTRAGFQLDPIEKNFGSGDRVEIRLNGLQLNATKGQFR